MLNIAIALGVKQEQKTMLHAYWHWESHAAELRLQLQKVQQAVSFMKNRILVTTFYSWLRLLEKVR